jgi:uncharacterized OB-fold protein
MSRTKTELRAPERPNRINVCVACMRPIEPGAERCPYCHTLVNPTWRAVNTIGVIVVAFVIIWVVMTLYHGG